MLEWAFILSVILNVLAASAEISADPATVSNPCKTGYFFREDNLKCYKRVTSSMTYDSSTTECAKDGATLVHINNAFENSFLVNQSCGEDSWIGMLCTGSCYWTDDNTVATYTNFLRGPDITVGPCVIMYGDTGKWASLDCTHDHLPFVCEYDPADDLCDGWKFINGSCFQLFHQSGMYHGDAESLCYSNNAKLASIHSRQENDALTEMMRANMSNDNAWIGLRRVGSSQTFEWSDGTTWDYEDWMTFRPSTNSYYTWGLKYLYELDVNDGGWQDIPDATFYFALCKKPSPYLQLPVH